ncbi:sigma-70 family RNA polymerase sigma factor [Clostridium sp. 'White wine YQ']|uniref:sigma-70 family RNA polymerase sigma factor n=1 Tax=Clostridium sp. 'White wine YQ' TaxID=3027474 RepID=UPI0023652DB3|nr:sigma-70 family RNA polymerase sigma factor [Clostridium sp. 'White wine YQ']MDD7794997.1 sigma-70 family RNA polymerase sigma factor [Clostridium sp. 'White wine YQ']
MEDIDIVRGIMCGDQDAIKELNNRYGKILFGVLNKVLHEAYERNEIEECFNDLLMTIWNKIVFYREDKGSLLNFLVAVAKYKAIDYKRKLVKQSSQLELKEEILLEQEYQENGFNYEGDEGFYSLIRNLKEEEKQIFIKRYLFEEPIEKIAKDIGKSNDYIYQKLSRGRKKIKLELEVQPC